MCKPEGNETILRYFELHLLHYLGYRPQLHRCVSCDSPLKPVVNFFSPGKGGILCPHCNSEEKHHYKQTETKLLKLSFSLSVEALKVLRLWQSSDYVTARRVRVKPKLAWELERVLQEYIRYLLQRELKSVNWLKELKEKFANQGLDNCCVEA
jgi:DNA repair protein RecO (recombination protein O)